MSATADRSPTSACAMRSRGNSGKKLVTLCSTKSGRDPSRVHVCVPVGVRSADVVTSTQRWLRGCPVVAARPDIASGRGLGQHARSFTSSFRSSGRLDKESLTVRRTHQIPGTTFSLLGVAALAAALLTSCDGDEPDTAAGSVDDDDDDDDGEATGDAPADAEAPDAEAERSEIVANLLEAGYLDDAITVDDGGLVIVGGDAIVTLEASR